MSNASNLGRVQQEIHAFVIAVAFAFVRDNSDDMTASCVVSSSMESFADFNMRWELCKFRKLGLDKKDKRKSTALQIEQYLCKDMVSLGSVLVKRMCFGYLGLLRFEVHYRLRRSVAVDCLSCFNMHRLRIWLRVIRPCRWYYWLCQKNQHSIIRFYAKRNQLFWRGSRFSRFASDTVGNSAIGVNEDAQRGVTQILIGLIWRSVFGTFLRSRPSSCNSAGIMRNSALRSAIV